MSASTKTVLLVYERRGSSKDFILVLKLAEYTSRILVTLCDTEDSVQRSTGRYQVFPLVSTLASGTSNLGKLAPLNC